MKIDLEPFRKEIFEKLYPAPSQAHDYINASMGWHFWKRYVWPSYKKMLEALILVLDEEYSYVFDDDYYESLPESECADDIIIRTIEKTTGLPWPEVKERLGV